MRNELVLLREPYPPYSCMQIEKVWLAFFNVRNDFESLKCTLAVLRDCTWAVRTANLLGGRVLRDCTWAVQTANLLRRSSAKRLHLSCSSTSNLPWPMSGSVWRVSSVWRRVACSHTSILGSVSAIWLLSWLTAKLKVPLKVPVRSN